MILHNLSADFFQYFTIPNYMIGNETETFMEQEVDRVYALIEEKTGPLAADGGFLGNDIFGSMPQLG